jgi:hypothetical protein
MHPLNLIWQQAQTGDRLGAQKELARYLRERPVDAQAWLLMATLLDAPAQQAECYRKVLQLDPQNRHAATLLQQMTPPVSAPEAPHPSVEIPDLFEYTNEGMVDEERLAALALADLEKYVARELGSGADRNVLIRHVCETGDMTWPRAEAFVARVALDHEHEITKQQSPVLLIISVGTLVGGVVLSFLGGYLLFTLLSGELRARLDFVYYALVTGPAMVAGGLIGLVRTFRAMRDTEND